MPPEIVVAMLAIIKVGGIFLPLFSGFGAQAVASRLPDCGAKFLFTADGFYRRGKRSRMKAVADDAERSARRRAHVVFKRLGTAVPWKPERDHWWHDVVARHSREAATSAPTPRIR